MKIPSSSTTASQVPEAFINAKSRSSEELVQTRPDGSSFVFLPKTQEKSQKDTWVSCVGGLGMGALFTGFWGLYHWGKNAFEKAQRLDYEGQAEAMLRLFGLPLSMINSVEQILSFLGTFMTGSGIAAFSVTAIILGAVFLFIELGLELYRLGALYQFQKELELKQTQKLLNILSATRACAEDIEKFRDYLVQNCNNYLPEALLTRLKKSDGHNIAKNAQICRIWLTERKIALLYKRCITLTQSNEATIEQYAKKRKNPEMAKKHFRKKVLQGKEEQLARRIGSLFVQKIKSHREKLICATDHFEYYKSLKDDYALDKIEEKSQCLYFQLNEQAKKARMVYLVGLAAIAVGILLLALSQLFPPIGISVAIGAISFGLHTYRFLAPRSYINQEEHTWSWKPWQKDLQRLKNYFLPEKRKVECIELDFLPTKS